MLVLSGTMIKLWRRGLLPTIVLVVVVDDAQPRILVGSPHMIVARRSQQRRQHEEEVERDRAGVSESHLAFHSTNSGHMAA